MSKLLNIPLFQIGLLFIVTSAVWYLITDQERDFKKRIFEFISDGLYYFLIASFLFNLFFNFREIRNELYRAILISTDSFWLGLLSVSFYLAYLENKKELSFTKERQVYLDQIINYFLLLGLANHLFYYFKYSSFKSILFIFIYFILYLFKDKIKNSYRNEASLLLLALSHYIISFFFGKAVIYYHIVLYPYQIVSLLVILAAIIYYFRRGLPSKQI